MIYFFLFILGGVLGSFANMLSYRLPQNLPIGMDRSRCTSCKSPLPILSLIPLVSYLILKGKCFNCKETIPKRYFFVELFLSIALPFTYYYFGLTPFSILTMIFITISTTLFITDLETFLLPSSLLISLGLVGAVQTYISPSPIQHLIACGIGFGIFLAIRLVSGFIYKMEAMGLGDVFLVAATCLYLGLIKSILYLYLSFFIGGIVGILLLLLRKKSRLEAIPFGPVLIIASYIVIFFGDSIWNLVRL